LFLVFDLKSIIISPPSGLISGSFKIFVKKSKSSFHHINTSYAPPALKLRWARQGNVRGSGNVAMYLSIQQKHNSQPEKKHILFKIP